MPARKVVKGRQKKKKKKDWAYILSNKDITNAVALLIFKNQLFPNDNIQYDSSFQRCTCYTCYKVDRKKIDPPVSHTYALITRSWYHNKQEHTIGNGMIDNRFMPHAFQYCLFSTVNRSLRDRLLLISRSISSSLKAFIEFIDYLLID